ncbi:MAG: hypothetical protein Q8R98_12250 [Rubrivivax sp.]|nr:hypothetical protein [Rubrivivax sp.]MDP3612618.1 hypothetical protein [Rubrivivax sp.]
MKSIALGFVAGLCAFLLMAELTFRLLPVSSATRSDYHIDPLILTYAPHHPWRYATGWDLRNPQSLKTNGHGFVSDHEFIRNEQAIALIGDSFVEAASLDASDRPAAQVQQAIGNRRPVYAMGSAGTSLLDYAERIRYAHQHFGVRDFIVLMERGDVVQALCGSGNVASQCLERKTLAPRIETAPTPSMAKVVLRESAFAQYMVSQLKLEPAKLLRLMFTHSVPAEPGSKSEGTAGAAHRASPAASARAMAEVDAVATEFFVRIKPHVAGQLVIAVDSDRQALMARRLAADPMRQRFIELAQAAGATVVDTETLFAAHFSQSSLSLDVGPYDGHLNPLGVRLVAAAVAKALE